MSLSCLVYDIFIRVYAFTINLVAPFNAKARKWVRGRKAWHQNLESALGGRGVDIWMHCASLGEFEQGRPVLEALKRDFPDQTILVTFFSPSGYEVRKSYTQAKYVCYLPLDTVKNARRFISLVHPRLVIFIKYEFWFHLLTELHRRNVPVLLVSAIFRPGQIFFRKYGTSFLKLLTYYRQVFVQDARSRDLLQAHGIQSVRVTGDTRFDRVLQVSTETREPHGISDFLAGKEALVAGSTWPGDEQVLLGGVTLMPKWIIAPHEVNEGRLRQLERLFENRTVRYSDFLRERETNREKQVLLIDNVGMLSSLYRYGVAAYLGGGFDHGIHNVLEAAVYDLPVLFGPKYQKFREARELVQRACAFCVQNEQELRDTITRLREESFRKERGKAAGNYVRQQAGATKRILDFIQENRLLTR